jgi:S-formylglutathione hydrolase FrmB
VGAAGAAVGVNEGVLPGWSRLVRHLAGHSDVTPIPDAVPGHTVSGSFVSAARGDRRCGWSIAFPPGHASRLPVAVVLHGRGADHRSAFSDSYLALDRFLAAVVERGARPFALASVDGGDTYWHARSDGEDAGTMVLQEFLPMLSSRGLDVQRVGFLGWSMGGYGSLALAGRLGPDKVAGVAAESPALWHRFEDTAPGAFDDAEDFAAATVFGRQHNLTGIPVRIDCGKSDPFYEATRDYVSGFEHRPASGFQPGDHDISYWRRRAPDQLRFLADCLSATR